MKVIGIIPARMGSSRFPGKPLAKIHSIPMIGHVYYRCKMSPLLDEVYVATCDQEIQEYMAGIGSTAIMTKNTHERCCDRTVEALHKIESMTGGQIEIIVMIQGDEPMIIPQMVDDAVRPLSENRSIMVSNLMAPIKNKSEQKLEELRARSRERYRNMTPQQRQKKNEYGKRYRQKKKLNKEVTELLQSVDNGGTPSVITNNLRRISNFLDVEISKSDKPIDVINNIRLEKGKRDA